MKRWIATLGVMLLMPTLAMAQGEMVSYLGAAGTGRADGAMERKIRHGKR